MLAAPDSEMLCKSPRVKMGADADVVRSEKRGVGTAAAEVTIVQGECAPWGAGEKGEGKPAGRRLKQVAQKAGRGKTGRGEGDWGSRLRGERQEKGDGGGRGWAEVSELPAGAVEFGGWARVVEAPSDANRIGRIHFWERTKTGWRPTFVAAESAAMLGIHRDREWGLYWAGEEPFEPSFDGERVRLGCYSDKWGGRVFRTEAEADEWARSEDWTGKAMVCVKDGGWVVVDPSLGDAGKGGEGEFLSLMNDAEGTGMEQCVRYDGEGVFFLEGFVKCFDVAIDDVEERNAEAEMLTSYGEGYHMRMRQEENGAGGRGGEEDGRGGGGGGTNRCVDEALWQAKSRGQGGTATEAHFVEMRRQAVEADRGDGEWLRETGPVPAELVGRYGAAMGIWVVVVRETAGTATIRWEGGRPGERGGGGVSG